MSNIQPVLYLSKSGDAFELSGFSIKENRRLKPEELNLDPIFLKESSVCKTHQQVLAFLRNLQANPPLLAQVDLYHLHHSRYPMHSLNVGFGMQKGVAHRDSIDDMIEFVQLRIKEKSTPHAAFDRIAKILGPVIGGLKKASKIPFIGMVPAALQVGIGTIQIIAGLALSILLYLPSLASENAKIIVERSWRHVGNGAVNAIAGVFQMIPFHNHLIPC